MKSTNILLTLGLSVFLFFPYQSFAAENDSKGIEFFEKKIRPVLVANCYKCHSAESKKARGGLELDTRDATRKGGDSGHAVVPGDLNASLLMEAILYKNKDIAMPPNEKLPDDVIADFRAWIKMGAPDPRDGKTKVVKGYGPVSADDLWCLKPVQSPKVPEVKNQQWSWNSIDQFLLAKMESKGVAPVGDANPGSLLRRVHYDLIGMPPSPQTMDRFLQNPSREAFVKIVDDLLASPQFGQRWGRHWLDVARYAESVGKERDVLMPQAWRYRNYVIDAFNADKPYDQFIREQIAGDLLPAKNADDKTNHTIATGFLTLGPKSYSQRGKAFQMDLIDDQIDTTSRAFLALTVSCARCHDHKFDPIPTKDYYSLAGIFSSTKTFYGDNKTATKNLLPIGPMAEGKSKARLESQKEITALNQEIAKLNKRIKNLSKPNNKNPNKEKVLANSRKQLKKAQADLVELRKDAPPPPKLAMAVQDESKPGDLRIHVRGEINKFGDLAPRGFLTSVSLPREIKVNPKRSGRLELAEWITDPANPLTARVAVNRIWHHLFGRGIVRTVDNFGKNGELPSHPELLDHLANEFVGNGWSVKKMIREIVLSRAYQLDAKYDAKNYQIDPDNTLIWRRPLRRLDAESIRDSMLAASGKLKTDLYDSSLVTKMGFGEVGRGINMKPLQQEFPYRSVYLPILRTDLLEILKVWDFAEPSLVVGDRTVTTVPAQALFLMNSPFVIDQARAMADRVIDSTLSNEDRIVLAYKLAVARAPSDAERQRTLAFLDQFEETLKQQYNNPEERRQIAWTSICQALFANAEFRYQN